MTARFLFFSGKGGVGKTSMAKVGQGAQMPLVFVGSELLSSGGKVSLPAIAGYIDGRPTERIGLETGREGQPCLTLKCLDRAAPIARDWSRTRTRPWPCWGSRPRWRKSRMWRS